MAGHKRVTLILLLVGPIEGTPGRPVCVPTRGNAHSASTTYVATVHAGRQDGLRFVGGATVVLLRYRSAIKPIYGLIALR